MKKFLLLIFTFFTIHLLAQSDVRINMIGNVDLTHSKYTLANSIVEDTFQNSYAPGYSIGLELEVDLGNRLAFSGGLYYAKMIIQPGLDLGTFYGFLFPVDESTSVYMNGPYLAQHEFSMIQLPFQFKKYFGNGSRLSGYMLTGMTLGFQFNEKEIFREKYDFVTGNDFWVTEFKGEEKEFKHMNSSLDVGVGLRYQLNSTWGLLLQTKATALEFRSENEKFKRNGEIMWKDQLLWLGQISLGLGLQRTF